MLRLNLQRREDRFDKNLGKMVTKVSEIGSLDVKNELESVIRFYSRKYKCSFAQMVALCLVYYFGDGEDHLLCEDCKRFEDTCPAESLDVQTTLPLLDKGSVVVGLPSVDLGE